MKNYLSDRVDVIVLAAGSSSRFGSDKRRLTLQPLLGRITNALNGNQYRLLLVLRDEDKSRLPLLLGDFLHLPQLSLIFNPNPEKGMGHSLSLATMQLQGSIAMVFLADMPFIKPESIQALLIRTASDTIVAPVCNEQRGHPVIFGSDFFKSLASLGSDTGAKSLLKKYADHVVLVNVDDVGVITDVDTPADWQ